MLVLLLLWAKGNLRFLLNIFKKPCNLIFLETDYKQINISIVFTLRDYWKVIVNCSPFSLSFPPTEKIFMRLTQRSECEFCISEVQIWESSSSQRPAGLSTLPTCAVDRWAAGTVGSPPARTGDRLCRGNTRHSCPAVRMGREDGQGEEAEGFSSILSLVPLCREGIFCMCVRLQTHPLLNTLLKQCFFTCSAQQVSISPDECRRHCPAAAHRLGLRAQLHRCFIVHLTGPWWQEVAHIYFAPLKRAAINITE